MKEFCMNYVLSKEEIFYFVKFILQHEALVDY